MAKENKGLKGGKIIAGRWQLVSKLGEGRYSAFSRNNSRNLFVAKQILVAFHAPALKDHAPALKDPTAHVCGLDFVLCASILRLWRPIFTRNKFSRESCANSVGGSCGPQRLTVPSNLLRKTRIWLRSSLRWVFPAYRAKYGPLDCLTVTNHET